MSRASAASIAHATPRRALTLAAALLAALCSLTLVAQDLWYRSYLDGVSAFEKGDYPTAERKILASIVSAPTRDRGARVLLVSQQRGFFPEYYLALICAETKKYDQALTYAAAADKYLAANDARRTRLSAAENTARVALNTTPPGKPPEPAVEPNRAEPLLADARNALRAGRFDAARTSAQQAKSANGGAAADSLLRDIDVQEFGALMTAATTAFDARRLADARNAQKQARALNVDNARADLLGESIARREAFDTASAEAEDALRRRQFAAARQAVGRARATNADAAAADALARSVDIADIGAQLEAAITARSLTTLPSLVDRLGAIDPRNPLIGRAQGLISDNLGIEQRERLGVRNYYEGRYDAAISVLSAVPASGRPRVGLYLAASKAALSLLEINGARRTTLETEARRAMDPYRAQTGVFSNDVRYLSPAILKLLGL